jgi:hypothetical protein
MCNVQGNGAVFLVSIAAKGYGVHRNPNDFYKNLSYLEAILRAYIGGNTEPLLLSSGLEDYFLGTYYFNRGRYYNDIAGLTHLEPAAGEFSAYRFHDEDPLFFEDGLRLTNKVGESIGDRIIGTPDRTRYTTYVWLYQWDKQAKPAMKDLNL